MNRQWWKGAAAATGMLILILDSKTALAAGVAGIELCLRSVIPALFPFLVLSAILTQTMLGRDSRYLRPLAKLTGIPRGAEGILLAGFLGGYPMGAIAVADARRNGSLSQKSARRMMGFCCNAGPAFIFGIAGQMFTGSWAGWELWGIHVLSALFVGMILPGKEDGEIAPARATSPPLSHCVTSALRAMGGICGWVVLMRIVIAFAERWFLWLLPSQWQAVVCGILELTNGCFILGNISDPAQRLVICAGMLGFGGICVALQACSAAKDVDMALYLPGKLLQTTISMALAWAFSGAFMGGKFPWGIPLIVVGIVAGVGILRLTTRPRRNFRAKAEIR